MRLYKTANYLATERSPLCGFITSPKFSVYQQKTIHFHYIKKLFTQKNNFIYTKNSYFYTKKAAYTDSRYRQLCEK
jgi:hypothetical protein